MNPARTTLPIAKANADNGPFVSLSWGEAPKWRFFPWVRLARLVYVGSVVDAVDVQDVVYNVEGEQHAIVAAPCRRQADQLIREGFAQPTGIVGQRAGDEFNERCCSPLRKPANRSGVRLWWRCSRGCRRSP